MSPHLAVGLIWIFAALAFVGGLFVGRGWGRRQAADEAATMTGDLAARAFLHGRDEVAQELFNATEMLRLLGGPRGELDHLGSAPASRPASKAGRARFDTSAAR